GEGRDARARCDSARRVTADPEQPAVRGKGPTAAALRRGGAAGAPARAQATERGRGGVSRGRPRGAGGAGGDRARDPRGGHARAALGGGARADRRRRDRRDRCDEPARHGPRDGRRDAAGRGPRGRLGRRSDRAREAGLAEPTGRPTLRQVQEVLDVSNAVAAELAGMSDGVLDTLRERLKCTIRLRGNQLTLEGDDRHVEEAREVIDELVEL